MEKTRPTVKAENAHFLKGHASWLYCSCCHKTIAYLCYVTYSYFHFSFSCDCGSTGVIENSYGDIDLQGLSIADLSHNPVNKRYCCAHDNSALFSPVPKNLRAYRAEVVCMSCHTRYVISENFEKEAAKQKSEKA